MVNRRISLGQQLLWRIEAGLYDVAATLARIFPIDSVSDFGSALFRVLGPLTSAHRVVMVNLRIAFPDAADEEIRSLAATQWSDLGRWFTEFPILDRILADPSRVEVIGAERLAAIRDGAGPVVFISGHFSSFEIMPAVIVRSGVVCQITYRATNNPYIDARIRANRQRYGVTLFAPKGSDGARDLLRSLGKGESVALMNDQKFNAGIAAPLFGVPAFTAPGPSSMALRFGAPLQPMSVQRKEKARFRVVVHDPIVLADTGDRNADIETGVHRINAFIEEHIRARPAEWFWVHKRWPNEHYKKAKTA
ncbi:MAG: lysophospholipid acyltransferase family protein [Phenylobacterium sp.]